MKYAALVFIGLCFLCHGANAQHATSGGANHSSNDSLMSFASIGSALVSPSDGFVANASSVPQPQTVSYQIQVLLHGAFYEDSTHMHQHLFTHLPVQEPYTIESNNISPLYVREIPSDMVDWVSIELRSAEDSMLVLDTVPAIVTASGLVTSTDGKPWVVFEKLTDVDSVYIAVRHRNHLAVMTAHPVGHMEGELHVIDARDPANLFSEYADAVEIVDGYAVLIPGDTRSDGIINARDRVRVRSQTGATGYNDADTNMDGLVNAIDRVAVFTRTFVATQVP